MCRPKCRSSRYALSVTVPPETMGGLAARSGMFSRIQSAATRVDSAVPASSSQTVMETVASSSLTSVVGLEAGHRADHGSDLVRSSRELVGESVLPG